MIDTEHENAKIVEDWFITKGLPVSCDDETVFRIYKDISYRGKVVDNLSIKDRIRVTKIQISYIRKNVLGLLYKQNNNSAKGLREGYVYAVHNPAWQDFVKIGVTIDVYDRLKSYQTSSPFRDYELIGYVFSNNRLILEKEIHSKFKRNNEWIRTDKLTIKKFLKEHEQFPEETIKMFAITETIKAFGRSKEVTDTKDESDKIKRFLARLKQALVLQGIIDKNLEVLHKSTLRKIGSSWWSVNLKIEMQVVDGNVIITKM